MEKIKFAELEQIIEIERASSQLPDQELMEFVREVWESVVRSAESFGARPGQVMLRAIFRDQVIVFDEGNDQHVRLDIKRNKKDGMLTFKNPTVVRQEWIEQGSIQRSDDETDMETERPKVVSVQRRQNIWGDLVGIAC